MLEGTSCWQDVSREKNPLTEAVALGICGSHCRQECTLHQWYWKGWRSFVLKRKLSNGQRTHSKRNLWIWVAVILLNRDQGEIKASQKSHINPWPQYLWKVLRYTFHMHHDALAKACPHALWKQCAQHPFLWQYASHLYHAEGSGVAGTLSIKIALQGTAYVPPRFCIHATLLSWVFLPLLRNNAAMSPSSLLWLDSFECTPPTSEKDEEVSIYI